MVGRLPSRILVHVGVPVSYADGPGGRVEGEPGSGPEPISGEPFACVLFMPGAGGEQQGPYRLRQVSQPTLMYNPTRDVVRAAADPFPALVADLSPIELGNETEVRVTAPELAGWTGGVAVRWQLVGVPQPFGPPGRVMGSLATLRAIRD